MFASFLITFREVLEASLIVATILGILSRTGRREDVRIVWIAAIAASCMSVVFVALGWVLGRDMREVYTGEVEEIIEGVFMLVTAVFISWAAIFLHNFLAKKRVDTVARITQAVAGKERRWLFSLAFFSVLREGIEITLFLFGLFFSSTAASILLGFGSGIVAALVFAFILFVILKRLPILWAVQGANLFLILFAGWLVMEGVEELIGGEIIAWAIGLLYSVVMISIVFRHHAQPS